MKFSILHTEAKYSVDGKDHWKVMVHVKPEKLLQDMGVTESLTQASGISHSTLEAAEREMAILQNLHGHEPTPAM